MQAVEQTRADVSAADAVEEPESGLDNAPEGPEVALEAPEAQSDATSDAAETEGSPPRTETPSSGADGSDGSTLKAGDGAPRVEVPATHEARQPEAPREPARSVRHRGRVDARFGYAWSRLQFKEPAYGDPGHDRCEPWEMSLRRRGDWEGLGFAQCRNHVAQATQDELHRLEQVVGVSFLSPCVFFGIFSSCFASVGVRQRTHWV